MEGEATITAELSGSMTDAELKGAMRGVLTLVMTLETARAIKDGRAPWREDDYDLAVFGETQAAEAAAYAEDLAALGCSPLMYRVIDARPLAPRTVRIVSLLNGNGAGGHE